MLRYPRVGICSAWSGGAMAVAMISANRSSTHKDVNVFIVCFIFLGLYRDKGGHKVRPDRLGYDTEMRRATSVETTWMSSDQSTARTSLRQLSSR